MKGQGRGRGRKGREGGRANIRGPEARRPRGTEPMRRLRLAVGGKRLGIPGSKGKPGAGKFVQGFRLHRPLLGHFLGFLAAYRQPLAAKT